MAANQDFFEAGENHECETARELFPATLFETCKHLSGIMARSLSQYGYVSVTAVAEMLTTVAEMLTTSFSAKV